jgi:broad specificity phosphatase PhoE
MKIYFATHATTTDNEVGLASGWQDAGLSELGIKQAKQLGFRFKDIKIDVICCSDLKRAVDTVNIAFEGKLPVIMDKRLRELNYGDFDGKLSAVVNAMKSNCIKKPFKNGESYEQAMERVHEFCNDLKKRYKDDLPRGKAGETILIVGHRATQYGLDTLTGKTIEQCLSEPFVWRPFWEYYI